MEYINPIKLKRRIILKEKTPTPEKSKESTEVLSDDSSQSFERILKEDYDILENDEDKNAQDIVNFELKKELYDYKNNELDSDFDYLYPSLNDPNFNIKIYEKKEFFDYQYDGKVNDDEGNPVNIDEQARKLCNTKDFELAPHQHFVRNFLSFQTPYNSLLLYHGLGTGKTCSAIGVAEEMRDYLNQMNIAQEIIIVASPNVQDNFRLSLFDETKLVLIDGLWNIKACTGNKFLKEINPMNMKGISREKVISQINQIINKAYLFLGYIEFANLITSQSRIEGDYDDKTKRIMSKRKLNKFFSNRLIIIDEVHNIKLSDALKSSETGKQKQVVVRQLEKLVKNVDNMRLLLLSATPMYDTYSEIIWLINLMNINDKRPPINTSDVFNKDGSFKTDKNGTEIGRELLERKSIGYVSFVRGENPFTFPYRIWPTLFSPEHSSKLIFKNGTTEYPNIQLNEKPVIQELEMIDLFMLKIGEYQEYGYNYIADKLKSEDKLSELSNTTENELPNFENMEKFGYIMLQNLIQSLNIIYPDERINRIIEGEKLMINIKELIGKEGMRRIMSYTETTTPPSKKEFEYKTKQFGEIFSYNEIGKYSSKIKAICDNILTSKGIVLIYSEYIDGGIIPVVLALESLGFTRHGNVSSLFKTAPTAAIDAIEYKPKSHPDMAGKKFNPAKYVMITGDKAYSPDNVSDLRALNAENNLNGEKVKVVLISQAGAEGLDFKNIRQIHVMDPWYNMNRTEQIIGRGVRNCSHKNLPFEERNVSIYLYGTLLNNRVEYESADLYIYRLAELKAKKIGVVSRALKEIAVDCLLNQEQGNFTISNMKQTVTQHLSNKNTIRYNVGDQPESSICDYMKQCEYKCRPYKKITESKIDTFGEKFISTNTDKIIQRIRNIFATDLHFYHKKELIARINVTKPYPIVQINAALNQLVEDKHEYISDSYGRIGKLINIGDLYLYQPIELKNKNISLYDRSVPINIKEESIQIDLPKRVDEGIIERREISIDRPMPFIEERLEERRDEQLDETFLQAQPIIREIEQNYLLASTPLTEKPKRNEEWYVLCSSAISLMEKTITTREVLLDFLIEHIVDTLMYDQIVILLNYLYSGRILDSELLIKIKNIFDNRIIRNKGVTGIILEKEGKTTLVVNKNNQWVKGEGEDIQDLMKKITEYSNSIKNLEISPINNIVGFISNFKNTIMTFKVKFMDAKRNIGSRCDQSGKINTIKTLNKIIGKEVFTSENTKGVNGRSETELCIIQEFYLRLFDKQRKNNKRWFYNAVESIFIDVEKLTLK